MKILLTGSTGYIGKRLLKALCEKGNGITCLVRHAAPLSVPDLCSDNIRQFEADLLEPVPENLVDLEFEVAFYLVHSMSSSINTFMEEEQRSARNFIHYIRRTRCRQIIYLSGISNSPKLSRHLQSRKDVESILASSHIPLTVLRAGIIVGSGSASFEIIRDLMEKMPVMITPKWVATRCQPVGISDVLLYLTGCMLNEETYGQVFDIGGADILTYREMLLQYAAIRGFKRRIYILPLISPRLSSYWLYFVTSTSYKLAVNLVNSMKVEVVCRDNRLQEMLGIRPLTYRQAVERALSRITLDTVISSWTDASFRKKNTDDPFEFMDVPLYGVLTDRRKLRIRRDPGQVLDRMFSIGGDNGWYYGDWLWTARGFIDRLVGGPGIRRGRKNMNVIYPGDALDLWRVLVADREKRQLLLFAEMKLPGEAWLEFRIVEEDGANYLQQTATFMPRGLSGRAYWYLLLPVHIFVFKGMARNIVNTKPAL